MQSLSMYHSLNAFFFRFNVKICEEFQIRNREMKIYVAH
jgi:uncharacterized membrane protein